MCLLQSINLQHSMFYPVNIDKITFKYLIRPIFADKGMSDFVQLNTFYKTEYEKCFENLNKILCKNST